MDDRKDCFDRPCARLAPALLLALAACSGGGGGGGGELASVTVSFATAGSTVDEGDGPLAVRVVLHTTDALAEATSVVVSDAGTGSATAGSDYTTTLPQTVTFTAGSPDGSVQTIGLTVTDDAQVEFDETVPLLVSQPSSGATIGGNAMHQLTIQDDDAGGLAALMASEGPNGTENALAYDELIDFGTQTVGAGPTAGTRVRITNAGGSSMTLGAPRLFSPNPNDPNDEEIYDFSVEIEQAPMPPPSGDMDTGPAPEALAPLSPMPADGAPGLALSTDVARLRALSAHRRAKIVDFPVPGRPALTLDLHRQPLPFTDDAVLAVDGVPVPGGPRAQLADLSLWSGSSPDVPGSRVFLALSSQGSRGFLELPDSPQRILHLFVDRPATSTRPATCRMAYDAEIPYGAGDRPTDFCTELAVPGASPRFYGPQQNPPVDNLDVPECRLAIETDYQLYQRFGSIGGLNNYVTQLVAAVSQQYFTDVQTTLSIAYLGVYTTAADPWTSQDTISTPQEATDLLYEFQAAWENNWPTPPADLAHFISGANLGGGVAYIDVLCDQGFGFGVSGNVTGNINWGTWTGQPAAFTWDFVVVAHELGHNFGSAHTHGFCPPLDQCYTNCSGTTACSQGTIMSYCHLCGGMDNIDLEFHPVCANFMRHEVNRSCLGRSDLAGGDWVQYLVRFNPMTATGVRNVYLEFLHNAPNEVQPFRVRLTGTAN